MLKKILKLILKPYGILVHLSNIGIIKFLSDERYVKLAYRFYIGRSLNLVNPLSFTEKIQWLKLYDRLEKKKNLTDKVSAKIIISEQIGEKYIIPNLGVYNNYDEINFDKLPNEFVMKCNHDSSSVKIVHNKNNINHKKFRKFYNSKMKNNHYLKYREYNYNDIRPQIIIEPLLQDKHNDLPKDYKIFCFNGKAYFIQVDIDRFNNHARNMYDLKWNKLEFDFHLKSSKNDVEIPDNLDLMISLSELISKEFLHARIDFYNFDGKLYFSEITFHHGGGFEKLIPDSVDFEIGKLLEL